MKILIFNTLYYPNQIGGAEKSVQLLAEGLVKNGHNVVVITTAEKNYKDVVNGVVGYYLTTKNLYWVYNAKKQTNIKKIFWHFWDSYNPFVGTIKKILLDEKPDVVHTNNIQGFSVSVWKIVHQLDIPIVHTLRDYYLLCYKNSMYNRDKNCEKQCALCKTFSFPKKILSSNVDFVVGVSDYILQKHLSLGYFNKRILESVVFNSIDNGATNKKRIKSEKKVFGFVGKLSKNKGIEFLLDRFLALGKDDLTLKVFGKADTFEYEKYLQSKYSNKYVEFMGFGSVEDIYAGLDFLIVPSLWNEPFGRIVPEANSYGVPVLASNRGGLVDLVKDGENGLIFDPNIDGDFENKMLKIVDMEFNNISYLLESTKNGNIISKYEDIYSNLIKSY